mmetsp:Transcript_7932/g.28225  ORF Transcript_7932/g.28225 Transcript_7932/m.28225 type:complete len:256 (+) Transcript_7932:3189-3956(+)
MKRADRLVRCCSKRRLQDRPHRRRERLIGPKDRNPAATTCAGIQLRRRVAAIRRRCQLHRRASAERVVHHAHRRRRSAARDSDANDRTDRRRRHLRRHRHPFAVLQRRHRARSRQPALPPRPTTRGASARHLHGVTAATASAAAVPLRPSATARRGSMCDVGETPDGHFRGPADHEAARRRGARGRRQVAPTATKSAAGRLDRPPRREHRVLLPPAGHSASTVSSPPPPESRAARPWMRPADAQDAWRACCGRKP